MYIYIYIYIYIFIDRTDKIDKDMHVCVCVYMYIQIEEATPPNHPSIMYPRASGHVYLSIELSSYLTNYSYSYMCVYVYEGIAIKKMRR